MIAGEGEQLGIVSKVTELCLVLETMVLPDGVCNCTF